MIYSMYFVGLRGTCRINSWNYGSATDLDAKMEGKSRLTLFAKVLKESKGDKFVFITTKVQEAAWDAFIKDNQLEEHVEYEMPDYVTNGNHPDIGRNLKLRVLTSKE